MKLPEGTAEDRELLNKFQVVISFLFCGPNLNQTIGNANFDSEFLLGMGRPAREGNLDRCPGSELRQDGRDLPQHEALDLRPNRHPVHRLRVHRYRQEEERK